ncbi:chromosome partitioning protein ParB [Clostridium botulinum]|uniref:Stage 0 sporulation protein J n=1 Tax=Clostridium botulinum (strain Hall / ATCC 3502 / NCTC 13319 / Type A) TaxID=441771 RepID=A5I811_CLOBH|nr:ParB/RepB/Spo0J family partition protein [Clostridium botulinum]ABS33874.1 stage 0 sporulation protein J [Clostridium botulinum A str. ATCC 19397]ABS37934.1 stage 0 sporulation protein J [Clostridium botulinum A str. Hall]APC78878.1 ParB/RepB/Spo0J family partition domain protein [Clostridium botulinum]APQ74592.1 ParB/RepB/Spo0J family partition domain protein [Clostridium botulinum]APQ95277.1 ParB/RepB/Spo0J family partition domain protein [Clostridium botulinum]
MNKKSALGKGLGALIPEKSQENKDSINTISINLIKPNNEQPRKSFDEEKIGYLAQSIKEHGIIQPLVLKKEGNLYTIVAGERRWRAAKLVGIKKIPAVVMDLDDRSVLEISLIENIQRQDLNCIEEAQAYKNLIQEFKITQDVLSIRIGKSRAAIANCMRLLALDKRVQQYLIDGVITEGHGRALLALKENELQYKLSQTIIDENLSVRETERIIRNIYKEKKNKNNAKDNEILPYYKDIKSKLESLFDTKVNLQNNKNKGKIEIEYYSEDDLQRILDILKL